MTSTPPISVVLVNSASVLITQGLYAAGTTRLRPLASIIIACLAPAGLPVSHEPGRYKPQDRRLQQRQRQHRFRAACTAAGGGTAGNSHRRDLRPDRSDDSGDR